MSRWRGRYSRKLQITVAGRWYVALSIALGVAALVTSNNVLYLIESLLLSGMILSGLLSERAVAAISVERVELPGIAGEASRDRLIITHRGRAPAFCVQIGEWSTSGKFVPLAFFPRINPGARIQSPSRQVFAARGPHRWSGWAVATSYPFGFARKLRVVREPGERLIWPARADRTSSASGAGQSRATLRAGQQVVEGEIRPFEADDDYRAIVWTLSAKGGGPMVRIRRAEQAEPEVALDLREEPGEDFERNVRGAARPFHGLDESEAAGGTLVLLDHRGRRTIRGKHAALRELALVDALGALAPSPKKESA